MGVWYGKSVVVSRVARRAMTTVPRARRPASVLQTPPTSIMVSVLLRRNVLPSLLLVCHCPLFLISFIFSINLQVCQLLIVSHYLFIS